MKFDPSVPDPDEKKSPKPPPKSPSNQLNVDNTKPSPKGSPAASPTTSPRPSPKLTPKAGPDKPDDKTKSPGKGFAAKLGGGGGGKINLLSKFKSAATNVGKSSAIISSTGVQLVSDAFMLT